MVLDVFFDRMDDMYTNEDAIRDEGINIGLKKKAGRRAESVEANEKL